MTYRTYTTHVAWLLALAWVPGLNAQLAITEVLSEPDVVIETNLIVRFKGADYWELTNFSTNDIPLQGYSFSDSRRTNLLIWEPFSDLIIRPGESIIFFRAEPNHWVTNAAQFRAWWGESKLPPNLRFRTYPAPGLDGEDGDELWLYDPALNVVDSVRFGEARVGRSFVYEQESGVFGVFSLVGVQGAFQAAMANDVGSPGTTTGPCPLRFVEHPADQVADAGAGVTFTSAAVGLPRPKYQWLVNNIIIPGATAASLTLSNVQPYHAGYYHVVITDGTRELSSIAAVLTVNTDPTPPQLVTPPADMTVVVQQTATFSVAARGYPAPLYQWRSNGVDIPGATNQTLIIQDCVPGLNGTLYTVRVWNNLGEVEASATLTVTPRPCLRFTEVMAEPEYEDSSGHFDWFEVTNGGTNTVNLQGYRVFDTPTFTGAYTLPDPLFLRPGESAVFVEQMDRERFLSWWGEDRLAPDVQVCTYRRFSLANTGEALYLWNPAATDPLDTVATVSWAGVSRGVSLECANYCDEYQTYGCIGDCLTDSVAGQSGAIRAVICQDLGSPGYTSNPPPRILSVQLDQGAVLVKCRVTPGRNYRLWGAPRLEQDAWLDLGTQGGTECILFFSDETLSGEASRFYRLEELP